ncbi:hypothetical protein H5P28_06975 [Ruficoccus amylovorans]|uniref:Uncharacterized protein n=1 Tax=Ruficoccus amylovorans TaxID=1804625 RepID=A0A842HFC3_9BACT|nr:hypothetical protein [Ruficoccus amylovorans]MBC2594001.1 hypothetical protein [Ruficoccus amylovorans]
MRIRFSLQIVLCAVFAAACDSSTRGSSAPVPTEPATVQASAADGMSVPYTGVDTAGTYFLRAREFRQAGWNFNAFRDAIDELGVDFLVDHHLAVPSGAGSKAANLARFEAEVRSLSEYINATGLQYIWNVEEANFIARKEYEPGKNFYEPEPGTHYVRLPSELIAPLRKDVDMRYVCYDEQEHMIMTRNFLIRLPGRDDTPPSMVETADMTLEQSYAALYEKLSELRAYYDEQGLTPTVEMVWPDLHHLFARAGWTVTPKLMKESWNSIVIPMGLGAAVQYAGRGADLWFNPDLWFTGNYPGHSVAELQSSLWTAHWMGATRVYVENLDYVHLQKTEHNAEKAMKQGLSTERVQGRHHPDADGVFGSLVTYNDGEKYELTAYGQTLSDYACDYRYEHPRPFTWRDARCDVAIVRFPDSCWGQTRTRNFPDTLLGSKISHSSPETEAWFGIWNVLSNGVIPTTGMSFFIRESALQGPRFFSPMASVLVFDHRVGDEHPGFDFRGAKAVFLTGVTVTEATSRELARFVEKGGICIALPGLVDEGLRAKFEAAGKAVYDQRSGKGRWLVTRDFTVPEVREAVKPWLPADDEMRYQFGEHRVIVRGLNKEQVQVEVDGQVVAAPERILTRKIVWKDRTLSEVEGS